jgi:hypothetical protein
MSMGVDRLLGIALLVLVACAPEEGRGNSADDLGGPEPCTPGEQQACPCAGGLPDGVQVCNDAGDRFGECMGCNEEEEDGDSTTTSPEPGSSSSSSDDDGPLTMTTGMPPDVPNTDSDGIPDNPPAATPPAPPPDGYPIVEQVAAERPDLVAASCVEMGGNNEFLYEVVRRLRMQDERWGLNWKRGMVGDLSQDVVDYHYGDGVSEESTDVYIIDIIVGHCGDAPGAGWIDVTQATLDGGTVGKWTLNGQDL